MKPSSHENGRIVEDFYQKLLAGDLQGVKAYLDPDTRIVEAEGMPYGGVYRGFEGLLALIKRFSETWTDGKIQFRMCIAEGDYVVALLDLTGYIKGTWIETSISELWKMHAGRVQSIDVYYFDTRQIADAAGV